VIRQAGNQVVGNGEASEAAVYKLLEIHPEICHNGIDIFFQAIIKSVVSIIKEAS
jgi:hypothetical protein